MSIPCLNGTSWQWDRALELDPTYVPARTNRLNVIALEEGAPLAAEFMSVEHYKDRVLERGRE